MVFRCGFGSKRFAELRSKNLRIEFSDLTPRNLQHNLNRNECLDYAVGFFLKCIYKYKNLMLTFRKNVNLPTRTFAESYF